MKLGSRRIILPRVALLGELNGNRCRKMIVVVRGLMFGCKQMGLRSTLCCGMGWDGMGKEG